MHSRPGEGHRGPRERFLEELGETGHSVPAVFARRVLLSESFGGIFLGAGTGSRLAALSDATVTGVRILVGHEGQIGQSGLGSTVFLAMCTRLVIAAPGRFSVDRVRCRPSDRDGRRIPAVA